MQTDLTRPTGSINPFPVTIPETEATSIAPTYEYLHRHVAILREDVADGRREALSLDLERAAERCSRRTVKDLLTDLRDAGFSWKDIARVAGVSVPAVQKWRRGDGVTGGNHLNVARIRALLDLLKERQIDDPVSWLEMQVKPEILLPKMDLLAAGRFDLVLELASDEFSTAPADTLLDDFDPEWRSKYVDDQFETFTDSEGVVAIRPRR